MSQNDQPTTLFVREATLLLSSFAVLFNLLATPRSATLPSIAHSERRRPSASPHNITSLLLLLHRHPSKPSRAVSRASTRSRPSHQWQPRRLVSPCCSLQFQIPSPSGPPP